LLQGEDVGALVVGVELDLANSVVGEVDSYSCWWLTSNVELVSDNSTAVEIANRACANIDNGCAIAVGWVESFLTSRASIALNKQVGSGQATSPVREGPFNTNVTLSSERANESSSKKSSDWVFNDSVGSDDKTGEGNVLERESSGLSSIPDKRASEWKKRGSSDISD